MERKFQKKSVYLYSIIIGTLIFIIGFLLANQIIVQKNLSFLKENIDNSYNIFEESLGVELFDNNLCNESFLNKISNELNLQREVIGNLERNLGKLDERTLLQKKVYTLAELEHLNMVLKRSSWCSTNSDVALFFYSNSDEKIDDSERVGGMMEVFNENRPFVYVYSFDSDLDSNSIKLLLKKYNITYSPSVVINNQKIENPQNIDELYRALSI